ncbi:MAG: ankyrin repeat domain-containing protein [Oscillospiraceae bacterium]|nr:ankyrin repeat domain-containing protein [Oscillospiraceae bacterium]
MQLTLLMHLSAVRVLFFVGITLVVLPIIFLILKGTKKINPKKSAVNAAGTLLAFGIAFCIPFLYGVYLDGKFGVFDYTDEDILYVAAGNEDHKAIRTILERGANPSVNTRFKECAFVESVKNGDIESVKLMLANGAEVNNCFGQFTPLGTACMNGDTEMAALLIERGAEPDYKPNMYISALTCAAAFDEGYNAELIELLCRAGADRKAVSISDEGRLMVPFKYYFVKAKNLTLAPDEQAAYDRIAELLERSYREWVVENAAELFD